MVQVPAAMKLAVTPETVQTAEVVEAKLTAKPELADAERAKGVPTVWAGMAPKLMVCAAPLTMKLCDTGAAAV